MDTRIFNYILPTMIVLLSITAQANQIDKQLQAYQKQGVLQVDTENGKRLWHSKNNERSCTSCHGDTPLSIGRHVKTRKTIQAMAPSVNSERYQDIKKIEKWFLRNCKWTFGRVCSVQEKADILAWLSGQ